MTRPARHDVAVLGCGLMGSALARRFASSGLAATAWNRTPGRAEALASDGVRPAASVEEALGGTGLVVVCMSDIDATRNVLAAAPSLSGLTVVNLSDGTYDDVETLACWLGEHGAQFLDGSTLCYPGQIGEPGAMVAFSGPSSVWAEHEATLTLLGGRSRHVSDEITGAKSLYLGCGAFFVTALTGFVESATCLLRRGRTLEEVRDTTLHGLELLRHATEEAAAAIESGRHETDQATIHVFADGVRRALGELADSGVDLSVMAAVSGKLDAAEHAGMGRLGYSAQSLL
ncbi:NAD(P)-binding domain-containing protein [Amycolatopsis circi]|uniref:NAD(P)-binding domain-containing protein n=1 Tax=Amycolatopsis circi TaxID=871959 RepID=UPI0013BE9DA9|nr:NAD(P)-binding domain-containing protein [Amycolatopsis circi]